MENLESWHGDLERGVRGSPDVGGLGAGLSAVGFAQARNPLTGVHCCLGVRSHAFRRRAPLPGSRNF